MNQKWKYSINSRIEYLMNRNKEVSRLRNSVVHLRSERIQQYIDTVIKAYETSTEVDKITIYKEEKAIESRGFRSIGLYQSIDKDKLFAENYYWLPFFSDVGRAISHGERRYMHDRLAKYVRGVGDTISFSNPDFNILSKYVIHLCDKGYKPNVMLAPIQIYSLFVKNCRSKLAESNWETDQIRLEGCDIQIAWSHKYAPLRSFIIFDSSNGIWHAIKDIESERRITAAIGESKDNAEKMLCFVETMAYYEILNEDAFTRINLVS
jgi:hypothetical protein